MSYGFTQDVPIGAGLYREIVSQLGDEIPDGLIVHVAMTRPEGGLRYLSIWENEADCDRFGEERLHPVVHPLLAAHFGGEVPDEPVRSSFEVVDVWGNLVGR